MKKPILSLSLIAAATWMSAACLIAEERGTRDRQSAERASALRMLFPNGETSANFLLRQADALDNPSPERELLNKTQNQQAIASLLKEERNKKAQPGFFPPNDKDAPGIKVRFDGIRFLRDPENPDQVRIRLVGPINEIEYKAPMPIEKILNAKEPIPVRFESITNHTGVKVTILTDMKLKWVDGDLEVTDTRGTFDFSVAALSPARLFYSSDNDTVKLPNYRGKRVSEEELPFRTLLEPEKL